MNGSYVLTAEVNPGILNGSYRESWPSDSTWQFPVSAQNGRPEN